MSTILPFRSIENKHGKDCMKKFCEFLREHAMKIINFKKKKKIINKRAAGIIWNSQTVIFVNKNKYLKDKKYYKVRDHCHYTGEYRGVAHSIINLKYSVPKRISVVFHNGSNYDNHFIIKELGEEFKKQFTYLGKNTEKCITLQFQ